jgi:hypothetical protein
MIVRVDTRKRPVWRVGNSNVLVHGYAALIPDRKGHLRFVPLLGPPREAAHKTLMAHRGGRAGVDGGTLTALYNA